MPPSDPERLEDCRFQVRRALYARQTAAVDVDTLFHQLARWAGDYTRAEIEAAAAFLCNLETPQAKASRATMGSTKYWQITSAGVLAHERNE